MLKLVSPHNGRTENDMKFDKDKISGLCKKIELAEPSDSLDKLCGLLTYYAKDIRKISNAEAENVPLKRKAVDYSALREDIPVRFADTDKLLEDKRKTENNCLCIPKII